MLYRRPEADKCIERDCISVASACCSDMQDCIAVDEANAPFRALMVRPERAAYFCCMLCSRLVAVVRVTPWASQVVWPAAAVVTCSNSSSSSSTESLREWRVGAQLTGWLCQ